jgi:hypothetical protein
MTSVVGWAVRGWTVVGLVLVGLVVVDGLYRIKLRIGGRSADAPAASAAASRHPYAGESWFKGWYAQPLIRAGIVYDPYRAFHKAPASARYVTVDSAGHRLTVQASEARGGNRTLFLLGGSTMWGYTARDSFTIPSLVSRELASRGIRDVDVVNLAQPGYNATQDVISLLLALRAGEVPAGAVFLTTHKDIYAAFQAGRAGGITSEGAYGAALDAPTPTFSSEVMAVARHSPLIDRLVPAPRPASPYTTTPTAALCPDVAAQYRELARITEGLGREYGFPFVFLRQPMLASSNKPPSAFERALPRPRYEPLYRQCMSAIDSTMRGVAAGRYVSLASIFDADTTTAFIDEYGYLTERAGGVVAKRIADLVEPWLRRGPKQSAP